MSTNPTLRTIWSNHVIYGHDLKRLLRYYVVSNNLRSTNEGVGVITRISGFTVIY